MTARGTILVVDDGAGSGKALRDLLTGRGHAVHACGHVRDALQVLQSLRPAAVVLGEQLGEADAMAILLAVRRGRAELVGVPVVMPTPMVVAGIGVGRRAGEGTGADGCCNAGWRAEAIRLGGYVLCGVGVGLQVAAILESVLPAAGAA